MDAIVANLLDQYESLAFLGTPGTGKSTLCQQVCETNGLDWVDVGKIAKDEKLFQGYDSNYGCHVLNEEKVN